MGLNNHTVFLLGDGTVKTVGYNNNGQCCTGNINNMQELSLYTPELTNVKQVACGTLYTAFLLNDGTVKIVGENQCGQCGTGNTIRQLPLYTIPGLDNVKHVVCGDKHTVFLLNDGTVKSVGSNTYGQCGTGDTTSPQLTLYTIPELNNVKQMSCGRMHTVFLLNDGTVKTVGFNSYGQCGTGSTNTSLSLYTIPGLTNVKQVACGYCHTVFLLNDGTVKTVGQNTYGQCGTGTTTSPQLTLYNIPGLTNVKQVSCGNSHVALLLDDGTVKTIGNNTYGQCGTGTTTSPQLTLYNIPGLTNVKQVACGQYHTVFLLNDGTIKTVGYNAYAQCGTGSTITPQLTLYTIPDLTNINSLWDLLLTTIINKIYSAYAFIL